MFCDRLGVKGRIWFPKNPWPKGHAITRATWSGRLHENGALSFDLDVASAAYSAGDRDDDEDEDEDLDVGDWGAKIVWNNYHACSLSSTKWGDAGIPIATSKQKLDWKKLDGRTLRVDPAKDTLPEDDDALAFGIYLLGHDAVADHAIRFTRTGRTWAIDWKAKIALRYVGSDKLKHRMKLELRGVPFAGFTIPEGMTSKAARALFDAAVTDPAKWTIAKRRFVRM